MNERNWVDSRTAETRRFNGQAPSTHLGALSALRLLSEFFAFKPEFLGRARQRTGRIVLKAQTYAENGPTHMKS